MTRIVVSDTSCMIDLRKVNLLEALLELPYTFVMPNTLFEDELLCLTEQAKLTLCERGLEVRSLPGQSVSRAQQHFNEHRGLALNDCFALALAEELEDAILMTGDGLLRRIAGRNGIDVRGVLWATDELELHEVVPRRAIYDALRLYQDDDMVFLPADEIKRRLRRLSQLL